MGPTCFLIRKRFLDSRFPPPHGSNVSWSDLIVFIDKLKIYPAMPELSYFKVERQTLVCTSSAISVMTWWESA